MDENIVTIIIAFFGGGGLVALFAWLRFRKKDMADTAKIAADTANINKSTEKLAAEADMAQLATRKSEAEFYRESNERILVQMEKQIAKQDADQRASEIKIAAIKDAQEAGLRQYEERAGGLLNEIRALSNKLDEAYRTIATLQETNTALQNEVKAANDKIAAFQEVVTTLQQKVNDLLEKLADSKQEK